MNFSAEFHIQRCEQSLASTFKVNCKYKVCECMIEKEFEDNGKVRFV